MENWNDFFLGQKVQMRLMRVTRLHLIFRAKWMGFRGLSFEIDYVMYWVEWIELIQVSTCECQHPYWMECYALSYIICSVSRICGKSVAYILVNAIIIMSMKTFAEIGCLIAENICQINDVIHFKLFVISKWCL